MLRTPFTGGAEARIGGTDRIEALLQEGKFWKYRAVSAGCASKLVARSVGFVSGVCAPTLFDIENTLKRYEGGLVHFDEQTPAYRLLGLWIDDRVTTASLFGGFRYLWYLSTLNSLSSSGISLLDEMCRGSNVKD
jgi:hypothetical protein